MKTAILEQHDSNAQSGTSIIPIIALMLLRSETQTLEMPTPPGHPGNC